ncbi:MAG: dCTP deaminase [Acetomicrobium sp.]
MTNALGSNEIRSMLDRGDLVVMPLLDLDRQIGRASLDVRLGQDFVLFRKGQIPVMDVKDAFNDAAWVDYYDRIRREYGQAFILHPGQFVLSSTLEFLRLPRNVMAYVIGRSSWGRAGLVIATATFVDPGFQGVITLELVNEGEVPISLYPGTRIAQLVFHKLEGEVQAYKGKYAFDTRATASRAYEDEEIIKLTRKD